MVGITLCVSTVPLRGVLSEEYVIYNDHHLLSSLSSIMFYTLQFYTMRSNVYTKCECLSSIYENIFCDRKIISMLHLVPCPLSNPQTRMYPDAALFMEIAAQFWNSKSENISSVLIILFKFCFDCKRFLSRKWKFAVAN